MLITSHFGQGHTSFTSFSVLAVEYFFWEECFWFIFENEVNYGIAIPSILITIKLLCVCSYPKLREHHGPMSQCFLLICRTQEISCPEENLIPETLR